VALVAEDHELLSELLLAWGATGVVQETVTETTESRTRNREWRLQDAVSGPVEVVVAVGRAFEVDEVASKWPHAGAYIVEVESDRDLSSVGLHGSLEEAGTAVVSFSRA